jgi:hypothetical protein
MPSPVVHLSELSSEFLLGCIAPDAVHMRPNADRMAKRRTHLDDPPDTEDGNQLQAFLHSHLQSTESAVRFSIGYVTHIITDRVWMRFSSFRDSFSDLDPDALRALCYQETDQADFNLYDNATWRHSVWEQLLAAEVPNDIGLVTAGEIDKWRHRTLCSTVIEIPTRGVARLSVSVTASKWRRLARRNPTRLLRSIGTTSMRSLGHQSTGELFGSK